MRDTNNENLKNAQKNANLKNAQKNANLRNERKEVVNLRNAQKNANLRNDNLTYPEQLGASHSCLRSTRLTGDPSHPLPIIHTLLSHYHRQPSNTPFSDI